jgi:hypothetical protein
MFERGSSEVGIHRQTRHQSPMYYSRPNTWSSRLHKARYLTVTCTSLARYGQLVGCSTVHVMSAATELVCACSETASQLRKK